MGWSWRRGVRERLGDIDKVSGPAGLFGKKLLPAVEAACGYSMFLAEGRSGKSAVAKFVQQCFPLVLSAHDPRSWLGMGCGWEEEPVACVDVIIKILLYLRRNITGI